MSENTKPEGAKRFLETVKSFPETKTQKTVTGTVLVAVAVILFVAGWITQNREVQTWAVIAIVPLVAGAVLLVGGLRKGGK